MVIPSTVSRYVTYRWRLRGLEGWGNVGTRKPLAIVPCGKQFMADKGDSRLAPLLPHSSSFLICIIVYIISTEG